MTSMDEMVWNNFFRFRKPKSERASTVAPTPASQKSNGLPQFLINLAVCMSLHVLLIGSKGNMKLKIPLDYLVDYLLYPRFRAPHQPQSQSIAENPNVWPRNRIQIAVSRVQKVGIEEAMKSITPQFMLNLASSKKFLVWAIALSMMAVTVLMASYMRPVAALTGMPMLFTNFILVIRLLELHMDDEEALRKKYEELMKANQALKDELEGLKKVEVIEEKVEELEEDGWDVLPDKDA